MARARDHDRVGGTLRSPRLKQIEVQIKKPKIEYKARLKAKGANAHA